MVVTKTDSRSELDRALEPYDENRDVPREVMVFRDATDVVRRLVNNGHYDSVEEAAKAAKYESRVIDGERQYGYMANPYAKWDWYEVGGRWQNWLRTKDGAADMARVGDIDFELMGQGAMRKAAERWDVFHESIKGHPYPRSFRSLLEDLGDAAAANKALAGQPAIKALIENKEALDILGLVDPDAYAMSREDYISHCTVRAIAPFAILNENGWQARGKPRGKPWGTVGNEADDWPERAYEILRSLPQDHYLWVVDCHS